METNDPAAADPRDRPAPGRAEGPADESGAQPAAAPPDDDAAWAAIVANFGDRVDLDQAGPGPQGPAAVDPARLRRLFEPFDRPAPRSGEGGDPATRPGDPDADLAKTPDAPFVPPPPPPLPPTTADRRAAWVGAIGAPALLLVSLLLGIALPTVALLALVAAFIGGFVYLVWKMPREPRDPGDDGARV